MNRILIGTTDYTRELADYQAKTVALESAGSLEINIGSDYPFNHVYMQLATVETTAVSFSVSLYDGTAFQSVVDVIDGTYGLTQSGFITTVKDDTKAWAKSDLGNVKDKYWMKVTLVRNQAYAQTDPGTWADPEVPEYETELSDVALVSVLNWVGNLFSEDSDLTTEFYDLTTASMYGALNVTSHIKKHIRAAEVIINELRSRNTIIHPSKILLREEFRPASVQKVAEMIYNELGDAYRDQKEMCRKDYFERLNKMIPTTDTNPNALVDSYDRTTSAGMMYR